MASLVIGCDEFLGAEVTRQILLSGDLVKGVSLHRQNRPDAAEQTRDDQPADDQPANDQPNQDQTLCEPTLFQQRIRSLQDNANARHFEFLGGLADIELEKESRHKLADTNITEIKHLFFIPEYDSTLEYHESVLAQTLKLLKLCTIIKPEHLVFCSHYGIYHPKQELCSVLTPTPEYPLSHSSGIVHAIESLLHGYCAQHQLPCTVLRLFELYGKGASELNITGRAHAHVTAAKEFDLSAMQNLELDFVQVSDAAKIIIRAMAHLPRQIKNPNGNSTLSDGQELPWQVFNLGTGIGTSTLELLQRLSKSMNMLLKTANTLSSQKRSWIADPRELMTHMGLIPRTRLQDGLKQLSS